jgi:diguanylate cyclase (GGDEF)-like protein/PAS domain S-box-containing protein
MPHLSNLAATSRLRIVTYGALISLLLLISAAAELWTSYQSTLAQGENQVRMESLLFAEWIRQDFREIELLQNMVAEQLEEKDFELDPQSADRTALESRLVRAMRGVPQAYDMILVDRNCQLVLSFKVSPGFDARERSYCKAMQSPGKEDRYVSERFQGASGDLVVMATQRVRGVDGRVIGLLGTVIRTSHFQQLIDRTLIGGFHDVMAFTDTRLQLLARQPMLSSMPERPIDDPDARKMLQRGDSEASYEFSTATDGRTRLHSLRKVDRLPLLVSVGIDKATLLAPWRNKALLMLAGWLACSILLTLGVRRYLRNSELTDALATRSVAIDHAAEAIIIANGKGHVEYVNPAFVEMTGYRSEEICGQRKLDDLLLGEHPQYKPALQQAIMGGETWRGELSSHNRDGQLYFENISVAPVMSAEGRLLRMVAIKHDVSDAKKLQADLIRLANTDELTGLYNRRQFMQRCTEEIARGQRWERPLSLAMLDLDHFKLLNDRYGHAFGDEVLRTFANCCQSSVRIEDVCGRLGGEEFAILLPDTDRYTATQIMERVRQAVSELQLDSSQNGEPVHFTVSIGISELYPGDATATPMMARADAALYLAKQEGRNQVRAG